MATGSISTSTPPSKFWKYDGFYIFNPKNNSLYLSEMLTIKGVELIRFGFKNSDNTRTVYCYVDELEQIGFVVQSVTCYYLTKEISEENWNTQVLELKLVGGEIGKAFLFSAVTTVLNEEDDLNIVLNFRVCVSGSVEDYICQQYDSLLGHQLWNSAVEKNLTDVEFVVDERTFNAHKLIITARSPVFKTMFEAKMTESSSGRVVIKDANPDVFEQFLLFLYTGRLIKPPKDSQLLYLADKYMIKTLAALCRYANDHQVKANGVLDMVFAIPSDSQKKITYRMDCKKQFSGLAVTRSLSFSGRSDFYSVKNFKLPDLRAKWTPKTDSGVNGILNCYTSLVEGSEYGMETTGIDVAYCPYPNIKKNFVLETLTSQRKVPFQMFSLKMELGAYDTIPKLSSSMECKIYRNPTVKNFDYRFKDKVYAEELWSLFENLEDGDIMRFQVGDRIFAVHRFFLAIRCPSLAKLTPHSLKKPYLIENIDPSTFEDFLYFIYTGMLKLKDGVNFADEEFFEVASNYPVETLDLLLQDHKKKNEFCRKDLSSFMMEM